MEHCGETADEERVRVNKAMLDLEPFWGKLAVHAEPEAPVSYPATSEAAMAAVNDLQAKVDRGELTKEQANRLAEDYGLYEY